MRLQAASGLVDDAGLVPIEFVQHLLRHDQFDMAVLDKVFERTDDGLLAIVLREVEPDARINQEPDSHAAPLLTMGNRRFYGTVDVVQARRGQRSGRRTAAAPAPLREQLTTA